MNGKQEQAALNAAKKLIAAKAADQEIKQTLKEIGLNETQAQKILNQAKTQTAEESSLKKAVTISAEQKTAAEKKRVLEKIFKKETEETAAPKPKEEPQKTPEPQKTEKEAAKQPPMQPKEERLKEIVKETKEKAEEDKIKTAKEAGRKKIVSWTEPDKGIPAREGKELPPEKPQPKLTLLIIPNKEYPKSMITLVKSIESKYNRICYISLNELFDNLSKTFENNGININKFFFIDAITKTTQAIIPPKRNCIFITSPNSLIELSLSITDVLKKQNPDILLFDSISTLLIYEKATTATKFIHSLLGKIKAAGASCFLTALEADTGSEAIRELGMFVDAVLTMTEYEIYELGIITPRQQVAEQIPKNQKLMEALKEFEAAKTRPAQIIPPAAGESVLVREEMIKLKRRLAEIESKPAIGGEIKKMAQMLDKISKKTAAPHPSELLHNELKKISRRLSALEKKQTRMEVVDSTPYLREELKKLSKKIETFRKKPKAKNITPLIKNELAKLSKRLAEKGEERRIIRPVIIKADLMRLERKIARLEKKPSAQKEIRQLIKKIEKIKPPQTVPKINFRGIENKVRDIVSRISRVEKKRKETRKRQIKIELKKKRVEKKGEKYSKEVAGLEKKMALLNRSYHLGIIGQEAYIKDKAKIEALLRA